jgi:urease accessory protein UreF
MDHFSDDDVSEVRRRIEELLEALALTPEEDEWSRQQGESVYHMITDAYTHSEGIDRMKAMTAAAALAHALIAVEAWAKKLDAEDPKQR